MSWATAMEMVMEKAEPCTPATGPSLTGPSLPTTKGWGWRWTAFFWGAVLSEWGGGDGDGGGDDG